MGLHLCAYGLYLWKNNIFINVNLKYLFCTYVQRLRICCTDVQRYKKGAMGENLKTCQANLARFITEKGVLVHCINGEYKSLKYSTIKTYISQIWNEEK